jgi:hypothetical protein
VAPDEALIAFLNRLGQAQVLLTRAADAGISPTEEHVDSLDSLARQRLRGATDGLGLRRIALLEGETADEALDRRTLQILREISAGTRNVIPMASITVTLRLENDWNVLESGVGATVERIDDLRGSVQETPTQPAVVQPAAPPVVDSVQN